jgi:hypothetical protein
MVVISDMCALLKFYDSRHMLVVRYVIRLRHLLTRVSHMRRRIGSLYS